MKKVFITLIIVMSVFVFSPINTKALTIEDTVINNVYILEKDTDTDVVEETTESESTEKITNCEGIIGNPEDPNSVAWLIREVMNYVKILGPILVIVLSSVDFLKVIVKSDDKEMAAAQKKLILRLILALLLFLIPTIVNALLSIYGTNLDPSCIPQ